MIATKGVELVGVVAWDGPETGLVELARRLCDELGESAAVGIGGLAAGVDALSTSLIEARHACRFARRRRTGRAFATHGEVGSHALLLALQDENVLAAFRSALLQPLELHDARRHTELVATLDAFLASGGALAADSQPASHSRQHAPPPARASRAADRTVARLDG